MSFIYSNRLGYYMMFARVDFAAVGVVSARLMSKDFVFDAAAHDKLDDILTQGAWASGLALPVGYEIVPTIPDGFVYTVTTAGTCGTVEPTWQVPAPGDPTTTTTDGTTVWTATWTGHAPEMPTANGYTAGGEVLTLYSASFVAGTGVATVELNDATWTAAGGDLGGLGLNSPEISGVLFTADDNDSTGDIVIGFNSFLTAITAADTEILLIKDILFPAGF